MASSVKVLRTDLENPTRPRERRLHIVKSPYIGRPGITPEENLVDLAEYAYTIYVTIAEQGNAGTRRLEDN